jgi:basic membrane protein A and related proteins
MKFVIALLISMTLTITNSVAPSCAEQQAQTPMKVGFICDGSANDMGWNYAHDQARHYLENKLGNSVQTVFAENVPESGEAERVMEKMIAQGCQVIFVTSYGYLEPTMRVASRHPNTTFLQLGRFETAKNVGAYYDLQYEAMYIAGVVAGRVTKTNKLGYVGGHPVPPVIQCINAFTLGARSVNPKATTKVLWINSWSDSLAESEAVKGLKESGVDVVTHTQGNQTSVIRTADGAGMYSVGCFADASNLAPKGWLVGPCLNLGPYYVNQTRAVMDHTWKSERTQCGIKNGYITLSAFGKVVPPNVRKEAESTREQIVSGKLVVFKGPLADQNGKQQLAAGQTFDLQKLTGMNFLVSGVLSSTLPGAKKN